MAKGVEGVVGGLEASAARVTAASSQLLASASSSLSATTTDALQTVFADGSKPQGAEAGGRAGGAGRGARGGSTAAACLGGRSLDVGAPAAGAADGATAPAAPLSPLSPLAMFTAAASVVRSISEEGAAPAVPAPPPWAPEALPPSETAAAPDLEARLRKLVSDALASRDARTALFLPPTDRSTPGDSPAAAAVAALPAGWSPGAADVVGAASGALRADGNLQALRSGLVPRRLSDDAFWRIYFGHVARLRTELRGEGGAG